MKNVGTTFRDIHVYYLFNISKSLHACTHISIFERSFLPFDDASFNRYLKFHLGKMEFVEYTIKKKL